MYAPGAKAHPPRVLNFLPELNTLHRLLRATLAPGIGDSSACPQYERNLIQYYVQKKWFSVFDYMLQEIISISRIALRSCGYAPQIMMLIEKVSEIEFFKDHEITDLKLQFSTAPIITKDVPSTSTPPWSARSGSVVPPSAPPSSSSSGGVLRVLKSMFAWCRDTHQRQNVPLSNQRHQNEKWGINEFDDFSLPVLPLDDDPFASLSTADIAAMEVADDDTKGGSGSEYDEEEEEGGGDDENFDE
jgi:hypothetical protein